MGPVVLVTGVGQALVGRAARELADEPRIDRVIGTDLVAPSTSLPGVEVVTGHRGSPPVHEMLVDGVDVLVHAPYGRSEGPAGDHTRALLSICRESARLRRVVLVGSTAIYGVSARSPAVLTEQAAAPAAARSAVAQTWGTVERYARALSRHRDDVSVTVLRMVDTLGPDVSTRLSRYLLAPVPLSVLGHDPRLQLLHADDWVATLRAAVLAPWGAGEGTFNVAADGVLALSALLRRAGRVPMPVPAHWLPVATRLVGRVGGPDAADAATMAGDRDWLTNGCVVDPTAGRRALGVTPAYDADATVADFVQAWPRPAPVHLTPTPAGSSADLSERNRGPLRRPPGRQPSGSWHAGR